MRLASIAICLIVVASFTLFVVDQTSTASTHQQQELSGSLPAPGASAGTGSAPSKRDKKSSVHRSIDDASNALTSPFSAVTAGSSSQWVIHGVNLVLALLVYGFALGFLARMIRVRL
jgi:hypothetical protein